MAAYVDPSGKGKKFSPTSAFIKRAESRRKEEDANREEEERKQKLRDEFNKKKDSKQKGRSLIGNISDFADQAADKIGGGIGRGAIRTLDQLLPGKNTFGLEGFANEWDRRAKTSVNWEGTGFARDSAAGKAGAKVGSTVKGLADLGMMAAPAGVVDKAVKGTKIIRGLENGSKAAKATGYIARTVPGSLTASGIDMLQERGRGNEVNPLRSGGIGLAADIALPLAGRVAQKGIGKTLDELKTRVPSKQTEDIIRTKSMGDMNKGQKRREFMAEAGKAFVDRNAPVGDYVKTLEKELGKKLPKDANPAELLKLRAGTEGQAAVHIRHSLGWIDKTPMNIRQDGDAYGYAKQLLSQSDKRTPEQIEKAQRTIDVLSEKYGNDLAPLEDYTKKMRGTFDTLIDLYEHNGLIAKEHAQKLRDNPDYFAKMEVLHPDDMQPAFARSSVNTKDTSLKAIKGHSNDAEYAHASEAFVKQTVRAMQEIANNRVGRSLGNIAEQTGDNEFIRTLKTQSEKIGKDESRITFLDNGVKKSVAVPKQVGDILTGADHQTFDIVTSTVGKIHNVFRQAVTTYNPLFVFLRNPARDFKAFMTNSRYVPVKRAADQFAAAMFDSLVHSSPSLQKAFPNSGKWSQEFLRSGGGQAGYFAREGGNQGRQIARFAEQVTNKKAIVKKGEIVGYKDRSAVGKVVASPKVFMEKMSEAIEMAPRVAEYKSAINKGKSAQEAALAGREVTVDFAQGGSVARVINQWVPFLNARAQGTRRLVQAFKENPKRAATVWAATGVMPIATLMAYNHQYPEVWNNIPDYEKDNNFIFILPGQKNYIKFPKGDVDKVLGNTFENMLDTFAQGGDGGKQLMQSLIEGGSNFSPVSFSNNGQISASSVASGILPPFAKAGIEHATNYSFFKDAPIVPENMKGAPVNEQVKDNTPGLARMLGNVFGQSPLKMENAVQNLAGTVPFDVSNALTRDKNSADRFKRAIVSDSSGKTESAFYKTYGPAKETKEYREKQIYKLINKGEYKQAQRVADEYNRDIDERFSKFYRESGTYMSNELSSGIDPIDLIDNLKLDVVISKKGKPYIKR